MITFWQDDQSQNTQQELSEDNKLSLIGMGYLILTVTKIWCICVRLNHYPSYTKNAYQIVPEVWSKINKPQNLCLSDLEFFEVIQSVRTIHFTKYDDNLFNKENH